MDGHSLYGIYFSSTPFSQCLMSPTIFFFIILHAVVRFIYIICPKSLVYLRTSDLSLYCLRLLFPPSLDFSITSTIYNQPLCNPVVSLYSFTLNRWQSWKLLSFVSNLFVPSFSSASRSLVITPQSAFLPFILLVMQ